SDPPGRQSVGLCLRAQPAAARPGSRLAGRTAQWARAGGAAVGKPSGLRAGGLEPRIFEPAETIATAWRRVEEWLDCDPVWIPEPTERHRTVLGSFMRTVVDRPKLVPDAHLAALPLEHGLPLYSPDGDYARHPRVR